MLNTDQLLSSVGDVDEMLSGGGQQTGVSNNQQANASNNDVASGNEVGVNGLIGDVNVAGVTGDVTGLVNSGDVNAGNVAGNGVTDVVGNITGAEDVSGGVQDVGVTNALPVDNMLQGDVMAPVTGTVDSTVSQVGELAGDVTGGLGLGLE